jgi:hypothetical protein
MSKALFYHGFGIRGYKYVKAEYERGKVIFTIRQEREALRGAVWGLPVSTIRMRTLLPFKPVNTSAGRSSPKARSTIWSSWAPRRSPCSGSSAEGPFRKKPPTGAAHRR